MKRVVLFAVVVAGCGPMLPDGRVYSNAPAMAAANLAVGGALYLAGGGCKISGCPTNTKCNRTTERCDPVKCDRTSCGPDMVCDEGKGDCIPVTINASVAPTASASTYTPPVPVPPMGPNAPNPN